MPRYTLNDQSFTSISVEADDILQVKSGGSIEIKSNAFTADPATFVLRGYLSSVDFSSAKTILVRSQTDVVVIEVIKGL